MNGNHSHLIGGDILASQEQQGWRAKAVDRFAADLQRAVTKLLTLTILQETEIQVSPLENLRRTRDVLLPSLLSGQVELNTKAT